MYYEFFGLNEPPFNNTPDVRFLYLSSKHQEALAHMLYGINEKKGFITVTGEIGAGKTTLCRALLNELDAKCKVALIFNSYISELELLKNINQELFLDYSSDSKKVLIDELNKFLLQQHSIGGNVVLIIDEAQNLSIEVLEQIRMLSNLETENEKLLQIILVGQPELRDVLSQDRLTQLRQRIAVSYHLEPLSFEETKEYIFHRLNVAGLKKPIVFSEEAFKFIYEYSRGVPRLINNVCDRTLLIAYNENSYEIKSYFVKKAISELNVSKINKRNKKSKRFPFYYFLFFIIFIVIAILTFFYVQLYLKIKSKTLKISKKSFVKVHKEIKKNNSIKTPSTSNSPSPLLSPSQILTSLINVKVPFELDNIYVKSKNKEKELFFLSKLLKLNVDYNSDISLKTQIPSIGFNIYQGKNLKKLLEKLNYPYVCYISFDKNVSELPIFIIKENEKKVFYVNICFNTSEILNKNYFDEIFIDKEIVIYPNFIDMLNIDLSKNGKSIYELKKRLIYLGLYNGELNSFLDDELKKTLNLIYNYFDLSVHQEDFKNKLDLIINILLYKKTYMDIGK